MRRLATELPRYRYRFADENELHDGIATVLDTIELNYQREYAASTADRFDFLLDGGVVIEAKVNGSLAQAVQQIDRYCKLEVVHGIAIVTTKRWDGVISRAKLRGKEVAVIQVKRQSF